MSKAKYLLAFIALAGISCTERGPAGTVDSGAQDNGVISDIDPTKDGQIPPGDGPVPPPFDGPVPPPPDGPVPPPDGPQPPPDGPVPPPPDGPVPPPPDGPVPPPPDGPVPPPDGPVTPDQAVPVPDAKPVTNDTCANAESISFSGSKVTVTGTTAGKNNEYGTGVNCGSYTSVMAAGQAYYKVNLVGGQSYRLTLASDYHYARLYVFTGCGVQKVNTDCGSQGKTGAVSGNIYKGQTGSLQFTAPYSGTFYLAVDGTRPNYSGKFSLTVEKYSLPGNTTCAKAQPLTFVNNVATVSGSNATAQNEFGTGINCNAGYYTYPGPQVYYRVAMATGHTYRITLTDNFYASMYVFRTTCTVSAINADCGSGGKTGAVRSSVSGSNNTITFKPTVSGNYTIAIDSRYTNSYGKGNFTLKVEDWKAPANTKCASATQLNWSGGKAHVKGTTTGAANEFGNQIRCGLNGYYALDGPQAYYKLTLTKGKTYEFKLKPSFTSRFYVFGGSCSASAINGNCGSGGKTGVLSGYIYANATGTQLFTAPVSGTYHVAVDSTSSSYHGSFELWVEETLKPGNGKCTGPQKITLVGGKATVSGTTQGISNEFGNQIRCGASSSYYAFDGPQAYYWLTLTAGKTYKVSLSPTFTASLYIFGNTCNAAAINAACGSGGKTGLVNRTVTANNTETSFFKPSTSGIYRITVDSTSPSYAGKFSLSVSEYVKPTYYSCKNALSIVVPTTVLGDTTNMTNEFGTQINCNSYGSIMRGPQQYFKTTLTAGKTYTFTFTPQYYYSRLYIFGSSCTPSSINADCGSNGKMGDVTGNLSKGATGTLKFKPSKTGTYHFAVDSIYTSSYGYGPYKLVIK